MHAPTLLHVDEVQSFKFHLWRRESILQKLSLVMFTSHDLRCCHWWSPGEDRCTSR